MRMILWYVQSIITKEPFNYVWGSKILYKELQLLKSQVCLIASFKLFIIKMEREYIRSSEFIQTNQNLNFI